MRARRVTDANGACSNIVDGTAPVSIYVDGPMRVIEGSSAVPSGVAVKGHSRMGLSRVFDEVSVRIVSFCRRRRVLERVSPAY